MNTKVTVVAGLLVRKHVERWCQSQGLTYERQKGFLDTQFTIHITTMEQLKGLKRLIDYLED